MSVRWLIELPTMRFQKRKGGDRNGVLKIVPNYGQEGWFYSKQSPTRQLQCCGENSSGKRIVAAKEMQVNHML